MCSCKHFDQFQFKNGEEKLSDRQWGPGSFWTLRNSFRSLGWWTETTYFMVLWPTSCWSQMDPLFYNESAWFEQCFFQNSESCSGKKKKTTHGLLDFFYPGKFLERSLEMLMGKVLKCSIKAGDGNGASPLVSSTGCSTRATRFWKQHLQNLPSIRVPKELSQAEYVNEGLVILWWIRGLSLLTYHIGITGIKLASTSAKAYLFLVKGGNKDYEQAKIVDQQWGTEEMCARWESPMVAAWWEPKLGFPGGVRTDKSDIEIS